MESVRLSNTDLEVSRVCMGTMTFGSQADLEESRNMVNRCLDAGVNFFDTANVYNQGRSEKILGEVLGARRADIVLASKVRGKMQSPPAYEGLSRASIHRGLDESLRGLKTDYLDIYYLHQPDYDAPIEETLQVMEELRQDGKIRYPAVSNYSAWQMCEIHWLCEKNGYEPPWISQPMYNLTARSIEQEYLAFTEHRGISNVCYNPLAGGLLTGKQKKGQTPLQGTRFDGNKVYLGRYWHDEYFDAVDQLRRIAQETGLSLVQLAIRWLAQQKGADCLILGASRLGQLEENLRALDAPALEESQLEACDQVWQSLRGPTPTYNR